MDYDFDLPQAVVARLSFCATTVPGLSQWAQQLPLADTGKTTEQLYLALNELCQLKAPAQLRFELMQVLTPAIRIATAGLNKHTLNHPVILPARVQKIAELSFVFQQRIALVYLSIIAETTQGKLSRLFPKKRTLLCQAIAKALAVYNQIFANSFALYRPVPEGCWHQSHTLYQIYLDKIAEAQTCSDIEQHYSEALLWGSLRANQLRQQDILQLQNFLPQWASLLTISQTPLSQGFVVIEGLDAPPMQPSLVPANQTIAIYFDNADVVKELISLQKQPKCLLSENLLQHLLLAFGSYSERTFMRIEAENSLILSVGLSNSHHHISGEKDFAALVFGTDSDVEQYILSADFEKRRKQQQQPSKNHDSWSEHNVKQEKSALESTTKVALELIDYHIRDAPSSASLQHKQSNTRYQSYQTQTVNMSANGYCLKWNKTPSTNVTSGEIVAIKSDQNAPWHLGAIRWVEKLPDEQQALQLGVELLSPNAEAYAAYITNHQGHALSDFIRVLKLPAMKDINSSTLITPAVNFAAGQKIALVKDGQEQLLSLEELVHSTGNYRQFSYKVLEPLAKSVSSVSINASKINASDNTDFDDVWKTLK